MKRIFFVIFSALSALFLINITFAANDSLNPDQVKQVKEIVHEYLITSPEVLVEASKSLQEKQMQKAQKEAEKAIKTNFKSLTQNPTSPILGNKNGNIVLVEFLDYQCGHCKTMAPVISQLIQKNKDLRVVIKELPIFGESSEFAAKAAIASNQQGKDKFTIFHKSLFQKARLNDKRVIALAKKAGLDVKKLRKDMESPAVKREVKNNLTLARALKLVGTPAFIITNKQGTETAFVPGAIGNPLNRLQSLIDQARAKK